MPDPRSLNPLVPAPLAEYLSRMTSLQPSDRPADGTVVAAELESILANI